MSVRMFCVGRTLSHSEGKKNNRSRHDIADGIDRISDQGKGVANDAADEFHYSQRQVHHKPENSSPCDIGVGV